MPLLLYNTLTRKKEAFQPIDPANVRMYVCGPTVYDYAHIGNARPIIVFDVLFRLLRHLAAKGEWDGGKGDTRVTYARNITDVDDKINARAARDYPTLALNDAIAKVTAETTAQFHKDIAALGVLEPTVEPRATGHIPEMVALCEALVAKGHAYVAADHVLFDVASMPDYGRLSNRSLEEMEAGARVEVAPYKKGPMDFVLWKPSKEGEPGWPSPCGIAAKGRPGWHIECSAMSGKHLGETFDIHGGGIDLAFPHHENEIAQSRCAHGTPVMANVWMHNGFLQVEGEKMSKSLGNFITIHDLLETDKFGGQPWHGCVLRFAMLETHYSQPIDWTVHRLIEREKELEEWARRLGGQDVASRHSRLEISKGLPEPSQELIDALCGDLNTPAAIAFLRSHACSLSGADLDARIQFLENARFLGLLDYNKIGTLDGGISGSGKPIGSVDFDEHRRLRVALANGNSKSLSFAERAAALSRRGIKVEVGRYGHLTYEAVGQEALNQKSNIEALIAARLEARKAKNWAEGDRIRDELAAMGIQLKDTKNPTTGEIATTWEVKR